MFMKATDIIRGVLDLIDQVDSPTQTKNCGCGQDPCITYGGTSLPPEQGEPVASRFKQIFAMLSTPSKGPLSNSPNEVVADIDSVTTLAGGGVNGPKHPADIRVKDPREMG
jgi:hypothetical protein